MTKNNANKIDTHITLLQWMENNADETDLRGRLFVVRVEQMLCKF
jgi:hypothetical protein